MEVVVRSTFFYNGRRRRRGEVVNVQKCDVDRLVSGGLATMGPPPFDAAKASREELEAEAKRRNIEVKGTGKDGNVLVSDLRAALG